MVNTEPLTRRGVLLAGPPSPPGRRVHEEAGRAAGLHLVLPWWEGEPLCHDMEVVVVLKCCHFLLCSIQRRNYCSLLEWLDGHSAPGWGVGGAPCCLEEGHGAAAWAFHQQAPHYPPLGPLLLSAGAGHWICHPRASTGHPGPVPSLPTPCLLPAAVPGLPRLLPFGWTHLVASQQDLGGHGQRTTRGGAKAHGAASAPRGSQKGESGRAGSHGCFFLLLLL